MERYDGYYLVEGQDEPSYTVAADPDAPPCTCADHSYRDNLCKHRIAALLRDGDITLMRLLAQAISHE